MMPTVLDAIIILFIGLGAVLGFKKGVIKSAVTLIGTIIALIVAYALKNPISAIFYNVFPFFNFTGSELEGVTVLNIVIYEVLAFLVAFSLLSIVLKLVIKVSGLIEGILKATIVLGIPSKLLGLVFGAIEAVIFLFVILFVFAQFNFSAMAIRDSQWATGVLNKTPFISGIVEDSFSAVTEIIDLQDKYTKGNKDAYNLEALDILLKHEVITVDSASSLIDNGKLTINNVDDVLNKYR